MVTALDVWFKFTGEEKTRTEGRAKTFATWPLMMTQENFPAFLSCLNTLDPHLPQAGLKAIPSYSGTWGRGQDSYDWSTLILNHFLSLTHCRVEVRRRAEGTA